MFSQNMRVGAKLEGGGDMRACDVTCDRWGRVIITATRGAVQAETGCLWPAVQI